MCLAVPGKVLSIEGDDPAFFSADVSISAAFGRTVNLAFTPEVAPGDYRPGSRRLRPYARGRGGGRPNLPVSGADRRSPRRRTRTDERRRAGMKYVDEYRDPKIALGDRRTDQAHVTRPWVLMEVCGGQTHTLMRYGIDELLPARSRTGPRTGMPGMRDAARNGGPGDPDRLAAGRDFHFLRRHAARARLGTRICFRPRPTGADVRIVYSPMDAVKLARANPDRKVVFFGVGFETTAPANAMAVWQAKRRGLTNFSMLVSHVLVPPAMRLILSRRRTACRASSRPGHVCTVMGFREYEDLADEFRCPIVVGGFEPVDLLEAIAMLVAQLEEGRAEVENQYVALGQLSGQSRGAAASCARYSRSPIANGAASDRSPQSGYRLREEYADSMRNGSSSSRTSAPKSRRNASARWCCRD